MPAPSIDSPAPRRRFARWLLLIVQIVLVLLIIGLLLAMWLPSLVGPHPGTPNRG